MTNFSAVMTTARMQIVLLRMQGLTLSALVQKGILPADVAAGVVTEAAQFLAAPTNDPATEQLLQGALRDVAKDIGSSQLLTPL